MPILARFCVWYGILCLAAFPRLPGAFVRVLEPFTVWSVPDPIADFAARADVLRISLQTFHACGASCFAVVLTVFRCTVSSCRACCHPVTLYYCIRHATKINAILGNYRVSCYTCTIAPLHCILGAFCWLVRRFTESLAVLLGAFSVIVSGSLQIGLQAVILRFKRVLCLGLYFVP